MVRVGLINIVTIQFRKSIILMTIEFINNFYTWGTGLVFVSSPLHLLMEIILIMDIFYFLNFRNQRFENYYSDQAKWKYILREFFISILVGAFITFIPIYSMEGPATLTGTLESSAFTVVLVHFVALHCLIFFKIFLPPYSISLYKVLFLAIQISLYYLGVLIISLVDVYQFKGIIYYCFQGRIILTGIFCTWMILGVDWLVFIIRNIWVQKK